MPVRVCQPRWPMWRWHARLLGQEGAAMPDPAHDAWPPLATGALGAPVHHRRLALGASRAMPLARLPLPRWHQSQVSIGGTELLLRGLRQRPPGLCHYGIEAAECSCVALCVEMPHLPAKAYAEPEHQHAEEA